MLFRSHPDKYLFLLSRKIFYGSKYPKNILFNFEKGSTGLDTKSLVILLYIRYLSCPPIQYGATRRKYGFLLLIFFGAAELHRRNNINITLDADNYNCVCFRRSEGRTHCSMLMLRGINYFRGELTDDSAKKEALIQS